MRYLVRAKLEAFQSAVVEALLSLGIVCEETSDDIETWAAGPGERLVALVVRASEDWSILSEAANQPGVIAVALLPATTPLELCSALHQGFAVVDATASAEAIARGIEAASAGDIRIPREAALGLCGASSRLKELPSFEASELRLLQALADGMTLREYADLNFLSTRTLNRVLSDVGRRLGAANRQQSLKLAAKYGLIT